MMSGNLPWRQGKVPSPAVKPADEVSATILRRCPVLPDGVFF